MSASTFAQRLRHGGLALPLSFAGLPIYIHAPDFYALEYNLPLATIGIVLLLLRSFDALQDPIIGVLSDRYFKWRGAITFLGTLVLMGGFWLLVHPPQNFISSYTALAWLSMSVLICTAGFSMASINMQAAGSLWPVPTQQRTAIASTREALGLVGLLMAAVVPALLFNYYPRQQAFHILGLVFVPLLAGGIWAFLYWLKQTPLLAPSIQNPVHFNDLFTSGWINRFLVVYTLSVFASVVPGILVIFYVRDYLQLERYTGLFLMVYFLSGVLAMPLWQMLANKLGKNTAWAISMWVACAAFIWAFFLTPHSLVAFSLVCACSGMALGADLALPQAIMADQVAQQPQTASRYYAVMAFLSKAGLALATGIVLPMVGWFGYQPGSLEHNQVLPFVYALIPCCIKATSAILLLYFAHLYYPQRVIPLWPKNMFSVFKPRRGNF